ncbi:hypothetical protein FJQ98_16720 [Lysinibacillus agricola]|uniref:HK97 gp10 family phage protein n=1 Tax=Lysinibacillus agricola TaxID=2590012 RepID=A0ABX7AME9_9BACI|nr:MULTISPECIES: hypothetical protein [Lysinibacillus]KOS61431.1 hypothetical protein AN161_17710 [Lysinibacillus sp. FJAT-14222]QQP10889.1 hypothetical protein FJQ98_16720 [Lysinibacillus agricola]
MVQFKDLNQLQRYLTRGDIISTVFKDKNIEKVLASVMSKAVQDVVYRQYVPVEYLRRGNDGGLSDVRNMKITKVEIDNGKVRVLFENLTLGQGHFSPIYEHDYDSLRGQFITDTIVDGLDENWYRTGKWSESRDFVKKTIESIMDNPSHLTDAIKSAYRKVGFTVK